MTYNELIEAITGIKEIKINLDCKDIKDKSCEELSLGKNYCQACKYSDIGNQEIELGEIYANLSISNVGKAIIKGLLNSMYGRKNGKTYVYADTDSTKLKEVFESASTHANFFPMNKPIEKNWVQVPTQILNEDCQNIMDVIDDATTNGLNFKYEDGKWYFSEG